MRTGRGMRQQSNYRSFFFVRPRERSDAGVVAKQLMSVKGVEEVYVTEGDCGFVVMTRKFAFQMDGDLEDEALKRLAVKVSKAAGSDVKKAVSYIEYSRA
jgi:hypothetical protein